ncbi:type II toxin-antitoxin system VapC family toxin [Phocaeicola oris]|uniref:type II toxin-antitoxin system VapC family toxin n=1 Tax=Phocaeicola oris TaxID=2896850 RepID=UPI00234F1598|nr:type II toxin-antitoxin system VapC family toxin [Phocaeicola oris]MCE2617692.1 type II toxin-antitoxin system VapC family toxin [Phocaeicola oris]
MRKHQPKGKVLLDSNILIHLLRKDKSVKQHIRQIGWRNCCVSEISVVELLYGAECSAHPEKNHAVLRDLFDRLEITPFSVCIMEFCRQKAALRRQGRMIEDNDLYIASTAIVLGIPVATENVKHLERIEGLEVQNWIKR